MAFSGAVLWLVDTAVVNLEVVVDSVTLVTFCCDGGCDDVVFVDWSVLVVGFTVVGFWVVGFGVEGFSCILLKSTGVLSRSIFIFTWSSSISKRSTNATLAAVSLTLGAEVSITDIMSLFEASFSTKNNVKLMCSSLYEKKLNCNNRYFILCALSYYYLIPSKNKKRSAEKKLRYYHLTLFKLYYKVGIAYLMDKTSHPRYVVSNWLFL